MPRSEVKRCREHRRSMLMVFLARPSARQSRMELLNKPKSAKARLLLMKGVIVHKHHHTGN